MVIPARNEARRIGPLLESIVGAPGVGEVIVVDDDSTDATAAIAHRSGARIVEVGDRPEHWAGKAWALQRGLDVASGDWIVCLDADTRPRPELPVALVRRAVADGTDLLSVAGRFTGESSGARWLHASMLTTLVYRFGPPGWSPSPDRLLVNGQCMAVRSETMRSVGGWEAVAGSVVEDVALARHLAAAGQRVDFLDAGELLTVELYESFSATWEGWGRSIGLPGAQSIWRLLFDLVTLTLALPVPVIRLATGRVDAIDLLALAARFGTLVGTRTAFTRHDLAYWTSPLADAVAVAAVARSACTRRHEWRGRTYLV